MTFGSAIVSVLATKRLTTLVTQDEVARPLREEVQKRFGTTTGIGYLVECPRCVSVWAGLAVLGLGRVPGLRAVAAALALSEAALLIEDLRPAPGLDV